MFMRSDADGHVEQIEMAAQDYHEPLAFVRLIQSELALLASRLQCAEDAQEGSADDE